MSLVVKRGRKAISLLSYRAPSILQFGSRRLVTFGIPIPNLSSRPFRKGRHFQESGEKSETQKQLGNADKTANPVPIKHRIHHTPKINLDDSAERGEKKQKKRRIYLLEVGRKHSRVESFMFDCKVPFLRQLCVIEIIRCMFLPSSSLPSYSTWSEHKKSIFFIASSNKRGSERKWKKWTFLRRFFRFGERTCETIRSNKA